VSRVLAVDWGTKRLGLAVSDPSRRIARPLPTLQIHSAALGLRGVLDTARREEADTVLIGLPLHLSGAESASSRAARRLGEALRDRGLEVIYVDERLSSEEARRFAQERGEPRGTKDRVDQLAAVMLLQEYLNSQSGGGAHA
jgi:putative holliday junction resolvase